MTASCERVDQPGDEWDLRPHHGQLDALALDCRHEPFDVIRGDIQQSSILRDPSVAGRAQQLGLLRRARERPHERVLTPAGSYDEYAQGQSEAMNSSTGIAASVS